MHPAVLRRPSLIVLACACALAGPVAAQDRNADPFERLNRRAFAINASLDTHLLRPAALLWKRVLPGVVREGLRNALSNLGEPVVFFNDMLQGRADDASTTLKRFVVNSSVGVAGIADVAKAHGLPHHDNGFGTTLGRYGAKPGPYLYLIGLGPSDGRDLFGSGVDALLNPRTWIGYSARTATGVAETISGGLNLRADADGDLQSLKASSTDEYATLRSLYLQNRAAQIRGEAVDVNALPDFDDPNAPTAPAAAGSVGPNGGAPLKRPSQAPAGDAAALPQAAGAAPAADTPPPTPAPGASPG